MNKFIKGLKISLLIILVGLAIPALLSIIFSGFKINIISIVNFEFFTGIIIALVGGVLVVFNFSEFRKKVLKTPVDREVEEDKEKESFNWPYVLFYSGAAIVLLAIALGEI